MDRLMKEVHNKGYVETTKDETEIGKTGHTKQQ